MEDEQTKLQEESSQTSGGDLGRTRVGFPQINKEKKGKGKLIFMFLAILALGLVGAWLIFGGDKEEEITEETTPVISEELPSPTPTEYQIDRDGVEIQILNGTGISGAAGELVEEIESLGYSEVSVGNASNQDYTDAKVTFSSEIEEAVKDEIVSKLESIFQEVDVETGDTEEYDLIIITGYIKGYSPTPTVKVTPTSAPTVTPSVTETVTPTP